MEAKQETIEQQQINELKREVRKLTTLVNALCNTSFLTEHQDGDEEYRKWAVGQVNRHNRKAVDAYNAGLEHNELWMKQREIRDRMMSIEQDYPELRDSRDNQEVGYEQYRYPINNPYQTKVTNLGVPLTTGATIVANNSATNWAAK